MSIIYAHNYVFPVVAGNVISQDGDDTHFLKQSIGTAFSIGSNIFLTAAHVVKESSTHEWFGLGYANDKVWNTSIISEHEIIDEYDIAIVKAELPNCKLLSWKTNELPMLEDVQSLGYPYAFDNINNIIQIRGFKGHVVSTPPMFLLKAKPKSYELSFQCPRGLSGAPLTTTDRNNVVGMVIGNKSTEMLIFSDKEKIDDNGTETIIERYESLQFGVSVQSISIVDVYSQLLGITIGEHLKKERLL